MGGSVPPGEWEELVRSLLCAAAGHQFEVDTVELDPAELGLSDISTPAPAVCVIEPEIAAEVLSGVRPTHSFAVVTAGAARLLYTTEPVGGDAGRLLEGLAEGTAALTRTVRELRSEAVLVDALHATGRELTAQLHLDRLVQQATDAATEATGAGFGAFFYNLVDEHGESYMLYTISGVPRSTFDGWPMPRNTAVFAPTFDGTGTVRSDDIVADPRFGKNEPYFGMPANHLPVRSYLAVSVLSPSTAEVLGGFFFGHPEPGRFTARHEYLAEGIASYTAIALDNARLFERERNVASELSRSMLPEVPDIDGLQLVARYLPAATGTKIGGDWFDVIELPDGARAFVIGDVVGHGVTAAAIMGQIRTGIRSYALLQMPPGELLSKVSRLCATMFGVNFATCFYAVYRSREGSITYANAGHLPALVRSPDRGPRLVGEGLAQPLGFGTSFPEERVDFPPGSELLLYTDGLVESRGRGLDDGTEQLVAGMSRIREAPVASAAVDELIKRMSDGRHDDDIAVLYVSRDAEPGRP